jgi:hypothetical protein
LKMSRLISGKMLLLFAVVLLLSFIAGASSGKKTKYDQTLPIPSQAFRRDTICGGLGGDVTAGDFFAHLERIETDGGVEFRRKSQVIRDFPARLSVVLSGTIGSCPRSVPNLAPISMLTDFVNQLKISAEWISGPASRPVLDLSVVRHPPREVPWPETDPPNWGLDITIASKDVPLTDLLNLSIQSADGHRLLDFMVGL